MRDSEGSADITRSHSLVSHLHDPLSNHVRKGPTVDEDPSELVDSAVAWKEKIFILCDVLLYNYNVLVLCSRVFQGILLSNPAHPLYHGRPRLFSGGRALTSNGIRDELWR